METRISESLIKAVSGEFELASVYKLQLARMNIRKIENLENCEHLQVSMSARACAFCASAPCPQPPVRGAASPRCWILLKPGGATNSGVEPLRQRNRGHRGPGTSEQPAQAHDHDMQDQVPRRPVEVQEPRAHPHPRERDLQHRGNCAPDWPAKPQIAVFQEH